MWIAIGDRDHRYWVYDFTPDRSGDGPARFFKDYQGYFQADALAEAQMCGVMARSGEEWRATAQGQALSPLPPVLVQKIADGEPIPLRHLTAGGVWDEVTVFMSLLFLAHLEKVKLWQKDFPYGEIYVKRLSMKTDLPLEELLAIPALGPRPEAAGEANE